MRSELDQALKKSEVVPTEGNQQPVSNQADNSLIVADSNNNETTIQEPTRPTDIANPF